MVQKTQRKIRMQYTLEAFYQQDDNTTLSLAAMGCPLELPKSLIARDNLKTAWKKGGACEKLVDAAMKQDIDRAKIASGLNNSVREGIHRK